MKKFWKNASFRLKFGLICTLFFLILGFVVYFIPHTDPFPNAIMEKNLPPRVPGIEKLGILNGTENGIMKYKGANENAYHYLGTTSQGQDIFWLLIEGIHNSLYIGIVVALIGTVVGVGMGQEQGQGRRVQKFRRQIHEAGSGVQNRRASGETNHNASRRAPVDVVRLAPDTHGTACPQNAYCMICCHKTSPGRIIALSTGFFKTKLPIYASRKRCGVPDSLFVKYPKTLHEFWIS